MSEKVTQLEKKNQDETAALQNTISEQKASSDAKVAEMQNQISEVSLLLLFLPFNSW